jgi:hypothetical protein
MLIFKNWRGDRSPLKPDLLVFAANVDAAALAKPYREGFK